MHIDKVLGIYKSQDFTSLFKKWTGSLRKKDS